MKKKLISIQRSFKDLGCDFILNANGFVAIDMQKGRIVSGNSAGGLYHPCPGEFVAVKDDSRIWHGRLCHSNNKFLTRIYK